SPPLSLPLSLPPSVHACIQVCCVCVYIRTCICYGWWNKPCSWWVTLRHLVRKTTLK
ncbi:mCG1026532, partial [Mus musculus]